MEICLGSQRYGNDKNRGDNHLFLKELCIVFNYLHFNKDHKHITS